MAREWCVLHILTYKCASRHSGVRFFRIETSKSGPRLWCFVRFDLQMCFAPQRRAIFRHQNFKKCSDNRQTVFLAFSLPNALFATAACHFSPVCWNSYLRTRGALARLLFRTSGSTNHWKNTAIRDVANISRTWTCFLLTLRACGSPFCWLDISTLLDTSLCFSTLHIVGS